MEPKMYFLSNQQEDHYFEANSRQFQTGRPVHLRLSLMSLILFFYVEKCPRRFSVSPWVEGSAEELWTGILSHSIGTLWWGLKCWGSRKYFKIKRCIFFFFVPHPLSSDGGRAIVSQCTGFGEKTDRVLRGPRKSRVVFRVWPRGAIYHGT